MGREPFLAQATPALGSAAAARKVYARAQMTYATALTTFGQHNLALNGTTVAALASPVPSPTLLANLPDLQALFGSLDYFECGDCQSVLSPAAYLVDLLQYLAGFTATGGAATNARDALFARRPDIQYTALSCNNTNITLPYIDLVNEILESAIAPTASPATIIDTTGTSDERRALPQNISQAAYDHTASAVFPLSLPFDLAFARTTAYINALGTTRAAILALFAGNPANGFRECHRRREARDQPGNAGGDRWIYVPLDVSPERVGSLGAGPEPSRQVIDPKTRVAVRTESGGLGRGSVQSSCSPQPGGHYHSPALSAAGGRLGHSVRRHSSGGHNHASSGTQQILSADTDLMVFTGLTARCAGSREPVPSPLDRNRTADVGTGLGDRRLLPPDTHRHVSAVPFGSY